MGKRKILFGCLAGLTILCLAFGACAAPEMKETTKNGKIVRREWTDESGSLVNGPDGYAYSTLSYSDTTMTEKYFDAAGQPAETTGGYYGRSLTYGNRHRLEEVVYLGSHTRYWVRVQEQRVSVIQLHTGYVLDEREIRWKDEVWLSLEADNAYMLEQYREDDEELLALPDI